jgi:EAL domain-containing protein (putative c-di-GMP-specific phosphodiesterase class I)
MSYLKMLPVDTIKIDRSFVVGLPAVPEDVSIVQAVITMAHGLGLSVVAEGVDAEEQVAFLAGLGCDLYQGFHFSKPLPAPEFERLLAHGTQTSRPIDRASRA